MSGDISRESGFPDIHLQQLMNKPPLLHIGTKRGMFESLGKFVIVLYKPFLVGSNLFSLVLIGFNQVLIGSNQDQIGSNQVSTLLVITHRFMRDKSSRNFNLIDWFLLVHLYRLGKLKYEFQFEN